MLIKDFLNSERIHNNLKEVPFISKEFLFELKDYDIFTTYQLISAFAHYNFNYHICVRVFDHLPEELLVVLFSKLERQGFIIPPYSFKMNILDLLKQEKEKEEKE